MKTEVILEVDAEVAEAARLLAVRRGVSLDQLLSEAMEILVCRATSYEAAKERALAQMEHGYDLGWTPPSSRDELHDR
jgi:hypothetical protein